MSTLLQSWLQDLKPEKATEWFPLAAFNPEVFYFDDGRNDRL